MRVGGVAKQTLRGRMFHLLLRLHAKALRQDRAWGCLGYSKMLEGAEARKGTGVEGEDAGETGTVMWKALDTKSLAAVSGSGGSTRRISVGSITRFDFHFKSSLTLVGDSGGSGIREQVQVIGRDAPNNWFFWGVVVGNTISAPRELGG